MKSKFVYGLAAAALLAVAAPQLALAADNVPTAEAQAQAAANARARNVVDVVARRSALTRSFSMFFEVA